MSICVGEEGSRELNASKKAVFFFICKPQTLNEYEINKSQKYLQLTEVGSHCDHAACVAPDYEYECKTGELDQYFQRNTKVEKG